MKLVKRLERYVSAVFTLGRVKGMAKDATRDVQSLQERLQTQAAHLRNIDGRVSQMSDWMRRHEALADDIVDDYRREAEVLKRTSQSDTVLLARMFTDLSRRLGTTEGDIQGRGLPALSSPIRTGLACSRTCFTTGWRTSGEARRKRSHAASEFIYRM